MTQTNIKLPFITLALLISFASVNAVLFTPALPDLARFFNISEGVAGHTITVFFIGYALGQLLYGPLANRFGRKPALYVGIGLQIFSSLVCGLAGAVEQYSLLLIARFILALGSGVGLKMAFTLVNECYEQKQASQTIAYLLLAFAIAPGLSIAVGGILNEYYGWASCFYVSALYGMLLFWLTTKLPETLQAPDLAAFKLQHLLHAYGVQFKNKQLVANALLIGGASCFIYIFAELAPFIAINLLGMKSAEYGMANILPSIGLTLGSFISAKMVEKHDLKYLIGLGIGVTSVGVVLMLLAMLLHFSVWWSLFFPSIVIYFGLCFVLANAPTIALGRVEDKAHGSATMNFISVSAIALTVLGLGWLPIKALYLPMLYLMLCGAMLGLFAWGVRRT